MNISFFALSVWSVTQVYAGCDDFLNQYAAKYARGEVTPSQETLAKAGAAREKLRPRLLDQYAKGEGNEAPFAAEEIASARTIRVFAKSGKFQADTQVRVLILPGMGWNRSDHGLIRDMIRVGAEPGVELPGSGFSYALKTRAAFEVIDMPGHGVGRNAATMQNPTEETLTDIRDLIATMRTETPGVRIVVLGWSGGAFFPTRLTPDVDGIVLVAPSTQQMSLEELRGELSGFWPIARTIQGYHVPLGRVTPRLVPNFEGRDYFFRLSQESQIYAREDFQRIPTLAVFSRGDSSVPVALQTLFVSAEVPNGHLQTISLEGNSHEPFVNFGFAHAEQKRAWNALDAFWGRVVSNQNPRPGNSGG